MFWSINRTSSWSIVRQLAAVCEGGESAILRFHPDRCFGVFTWWQTEYVFGKKHFKKRFRFRKKTVAFIAFSCKRDMEMQRFRNDFGRKRLRVNGALVTSTWGSRVLAICWAIARTSLQYLAYPKNAHPAKNLIRLASSQGDSIRMGPRMGRNEWLAAKISILILYVVRKWMPAWPYVT